MKRTTLTINYKDSTNSLFVEQFDVNLERFKDILYIDEKDIGDVVRQIEKIERVINRIRRDGLVQRPWLM